MKKILLVVVSLLVCLEAFAESDAIRDYRRILLSEAFESAGIENGPTLEELEAKLEVPLTDEVLYSSVCIENDVYVLSTQGIHEISTDGEHMYYTYDTSTITIRQLFVQNGELWGFVLCKDGDNGESISYYGKIALYGEKVRIERNVDLDLDMYDNKEEYGRQVGNQYDLFAMEGRTYAVDYVDSNAKGVCLISFDCDTGEGINLGKYYGVYDLVPYKDSAILALHETKMHLFQDFDVRITTGENWSHKVMTLFDTQTNTYEIIMEFEGNGYYASNGYVIWGGSPAGMVYNKDENCLYYTYLGELHRVEGLNFETDEVIAEAPGNWLYPTGCWTKSYVTEDGHYMNIVPYVGVDIIDLNV